MPPKGTKARRAPILGNDSADELESAIRECWKDGLKDVDAVIICQAYYDTEKYHLSTVSYRKLREALGLFSTRKQDWTIETANEVLQAARGRHPQAGIQEMINILRVESDGEIRLTRTVVHDWMKEYEPEQLQLRKRRLVKRRQYYCAGVNHIWAIDQHDKWKRFGLWLHVGLDVFSGNILWMRAYWTNSNPRLICKYHLDVIQEVGGMPLLTFSDPRSENFGVANAQSTLRQMLDPSLAGSMQHKWMRRHSNIKPEILWSQFRARAAPQLESRMQEGIDKDWYNPHHNIEMLIFRWVWMPLIQAEIDNFVHRYNTYHKRANKKTLLPNGKPKYIFKYPKQFDADDYKVLVPANALDEVRTRYANPDDPVFTWIPPNFEQHALHFYHQGGSVPITLDNAWACYHYVLDQFRALADGPQLMPELHFQGELQANLLVQSESGSHRGDEWGYDFQEEPATQPPQPDDNALMGEVYFEGSDKDNPEVDFSGDELDEDGGVFD